MKLVLAREQRRFSSSLACPQTLHTPVIVGEAGKAFPTELSSVLQIAHPSLLIITPAALSPKLRKAGVISTILPAPFVDAPWQVIQIAQSGTMEISSSVSGWNVSAAA